MKQQLKYLVSLIALFVFFTQLTLADTDYNQAKKMLDAGEILSLEQILTKVSKHTPGRILELELEIEGEQPLYEIELIDTEGIVWELKVNAKTAKLIERKQDK